MKSHLVFLHGWGVNASVWKPIIGAVKRQYELTVLDLPGYGDDLGYSGEYSLDAVVGAVLARAPEKATWVGWSLGGTVAMHAALTHPQRFEKLQLISATPCFTKREDWEFGTDIEPFQAFAQQFDHDYEKALGKFLLLQSLTKDRSKMTATKTLVRELKQDLLQSAQPSQTVLQGGLEILHQTDLRSRIQEIKVETQVLSGKDDHVVPIEASRSIFDDLPNAHSFHSFDSGHLPFLQEPRKYSEVLNQFLTSGA